jgi:carbonic anhydrase/acetyltransferase-like protein (isoleucine patch superfamily)
MLYVLAGVNPRLTGGNHFIAPGAHVIGDVELCERVSVWFNAVIRADNEPIVVGAGSNIQEHSMLHTDPGFPLTVGKGVTIGHHVTVHGCTLGDYSLVGINAVVLNGAKIGDHSIIGANSLVTEGMEVPSGVLVVGTPAKVKRKLNDEEKKALEEGATHYMKNARRFTRSLRTTSGAPWYKPFA